MIDTEQAQYAIDNAIYSIREACISLFDKRKELESKSEMAGVADHIAVINLRLDTLAKVELKLLTPLQEEYKYVGLPVDQQELGRGPAMAKERRTRFVESMMQGL